MKKNLLIPAILLTFFTAGANAQNPKPLPSPPDEGDVVKITTTLIQVDVTVTDKKGKIVTDLKPEEIQIFENGKKQEITNFSFISNIREKEENPAPPSGDIAAPAPPATVKPDQVRRTLAFVVDDLTLSWESTNLVRHTLKKFVDEQMQPGDLVAIIRTAGGLGALQQFTTDKRLLYAAIEKVKWYPIGNGGISAFAPIGADPIGNVAGLSEENKEEYEEFLRKSNEDREAIFSVGSLGAISYVVRGMSELPGRKSIVLLSDGFRLFEKDRFGMRSSGRVLDAVKQLIDDANRSAVVIYTIDARGLQYTGLTAADNTAFMSQADIARQVQARDDQLFETQEVLQVLARDTGGTSIINNNNLSLGIRKILDDQSYYLIGYQPDDETFDPRTRRYNKLEIRVTRPGVNVRYRSGFFGIPKKEEPLPMAGKTAKEQVLYAITSPFGVTGINLRLNALFVSDSAKKLYIKSFVFIEAGDLKFSEPVDGKRTVAFDILAIGFGDNGTVADQIGQTFEVKVGERAYAEIVKGGLVYDFVFPIKKPGAYQLRIALRDHASEKLGAASQFIEVPDLKKNRLTLSGIVLENVEYDTWKKTQENGAAQANQAVGSNPIGNTARRQFKIGTVLNYGGEIFNSRMIKGKIENVSFRPRIFRDGKLVFEGAPQPAIESASKGSTRADYYGSLSLGSEMEPGDYVLQIVAVDEATNKKRRIASQFVQFEIIP